MNENQFLALLIILAAIGGFLFGYDTGVISGAMVLLKERFDLSDLWQEGIVASTIGMAGVFSLVGGITTEYFGRKPVILVASVVFTAGAIIMAAAFNKKLLLVGRQIIGIGIGLSSSTIPIYIGEVAPVKIRGRLVAIQVAMITGGQLFASLIDGAFSGDKQNGWRFMLGIAAIPAVIQLVGFIFMPESPVWLTLRKPSPDHSLAVLRKLRSEAVFEEERSELLAYKEQLCNEPSTMEKLKLMMQKKTTRRALITGSMLQIIQQLSGINTFMYYSGSILQSSGIGDASTVIWLAAVPAAANFIFTFVGMWAVEQIGRRYLAMSSLFVACIGLLCLSGSLYLMSTDNQPVDVIEQTLSSDGDDCSTADDCKSCVKKSDCGFCFLAHGSNHTQGSCLLYDNNDDTHSDFGRCANDSFMDTNGLKWAPDYCPSKYAYLTVISMVIYLGGFASGMGSLPWVINAEIYPMWGRGVGSGISTTFNWGANLIISFTFVTISEALTQQVFFLITAIFNFVSIFFILLFVPETKGVPLDQVEHLFEGSSCFVGLRKRDQRLLE